MTPPTVLRKGTCVCGHAEREHESDHICHECAQDVVGDDHCEVRSCGCESYLAACQNCGEARKFAERNFDVCSRRCLYQLEYAKALVA